MSKAITFCLIVVGLINFSPVFAALSTQKIEAAYSVTLMGNDIAILMRHRALLFGILGAFVIYSAFNPLYRTPAMLMAGASMLGFALLVLSIGGYNTAIAKVFVIDLLGITILVIEIVLRYMLSKKPQTG